MYVIVKFFSLDMRAGLRGKMNLGLRGKMNLSGMNSPIYTKAFPTYTERILEG